ncbi:MAG: hypothetical protein JWM95_750 [Gemmatimonadetes bacterium]|nr:hypothetical protein [Gemmatimonadota bacterium]
MADIATLSIVVENADVPKATASLEGLSVAGAKSEAATQRLTRRMALLEIEARSIDTAMRAVAVGVEYTSRAMGLEQIKAMEMDAAMQKAAVDSRALAEAQRIAATSVDYTSRAMGLAEIEARKMDAAMGLTGRTSAALSNSFAAFGAIAAVGFLGREFISNTVEAQNAMAQLEAAVKSTGGVAGQSVAQLDAFSMAMQQTTTYSDEAVKGAQAMLLTFDKIRGAKFDQATQAVADLAARMGGDLQGAAVQVGKALQDPATGLTALRHSGVSFTESQVAMIKQMYETNRVAEGQAIILKELEHQFGGSAAAARNTLGGALAGLKNDFGDIFEGTTKETSALVDFLHAAASVARTVNEYRDMLKATGEAAAIAGVGVGTFTLAMKASTLGMAGFAAAAAPIVALAAAFGVLVIAMQNAHAEIQQQQDDADEATKHGKAYLDYLKARGVAHSQSGGAGALVKPPATEESEAVKKFHQLTGEIEEQVAKQRALNAVFGQGALAIQLVGIQQDEAIKNKKIDIALSEDQRARVIALNHAYANQLELAARLADAEAQRLRDVSLRAANAAVLIQAEIRTSERRADMAIAGEADVGSAMVRTTSLIQAATTAVLGYGLAFKAVSIGVVRDASTAHLTTSQLADDVIAQQQRIKTAFVNAGGEQPAVKAASEMEQITKNFLKSSQAAVSGFFENFFEQGISSIGDFLSQTRTLIFKLFAELASAKLMEKLFAGSPAMAAMLGITPKAPTGHGVLSDGTVSAASKWGAGAGIALGAGAVGYGVGSQLYSNQRSDSANTALGAFGGAASGAAMGAALGSVVPGIGTAVGAIVGGAAGFIGGVLGMANASKEAARQMVEARKGIVLSMQGLRAAVAGNDLDAAIAHVTDDREERRKAIEAAYAGGGAGSETVRQRNVLLAEMNRLEDERIQQLVHEAAVAHQRLLEDTQVQILRNNGQADAADALARQIDQERRFADLRKSGLDEGTIAALALSEAAKLAADNAIKARDAQRAMEDLSVRMLTAQGQSQAASDATFRNQQQREYQDAVTAQKSDEYLRLLTAVQMQEAIQRGVQQETERLTKLVQDNAAAEAARFDQQIKLQQDALQVNAEQLRAQEQVAQLTQRAYDSLRTLNDSLKLNTSLTTLSPVQQLAEARRQFEAQAALARGGDRDAASGINSYLQAYLTADRAVNASGPKYAADFAAAQATIDALTSQYGAQLTTDQQILKQLQDQNAAMTAQLQALQAAKDQAAQLAAQQIAQLQRIASNTTAASNPIPITIPTGNGGYIVIDGRTGQVLSQGGAPTGSPASTTSIADQTLPQLLAPAQQTASNTSQTANSTAATAAATAATAWSAQATTQITSAGFAAMDNRLASLERAIASLADALAARAY